MPSVDVSVPTPDGICPAVLSTPEGEGPWPAVIVFMDAGGVRPAMRVLAQHLADLGYVAFLPEMYYRHGEIEPIDIGDFGDPVKRERLMALVMSVTKANAASDTGAFLDFLAARPEVAGTKVGTTGYCMGGGLSLNAAARFPERVAAAASFHGGNLAGDAPDSPHLIAGNIAGRVYVAAAENDRSFPPEQEARLVAALSDGGVDFTLETYPAAHGFAVIDSPVHDDAAEARHWAALEDLYGATLSA